MKNPNPTQKPGTRPAETQQQPQQVQQPQTQAQVLAVPVPLAQAVVNYLMTQPYGQVADLIANLQQCQPFNIVENVP